MNRVAIGATALALLTSVAPAIAQSTVYTTINAQSGKPVRLGAYAGLNKDCSQGPLPEIKVTQIPSARALRGQGTQNGDPLRPVPGPGRRDRFAGGRPADRPLFGLTPEAIGVGAQGIGTGFPGDLVLDAGALIAFERGDQRLIGVLRKALGLGAQVFIPAADAHVVCCAVEHAAAIATSDPTDMQSLTEPSERVASIAV